MPVNSAFFNAPVTICLVFLSQINSRMRLLLCSLLLAGLFSCKNKDPKTIDTPPANGPRNLSFSIIATYPHDTSSFTEGLLFYKGGLYESTGNYGRSKLLKLDLKTGKALQQISLDKPISVKASPSSMIPYSR